MPASSPVKTTWSPAAPETDGEPAARRRCGCPLERVGPGPRSGSHLRAVEARFGRGPGAVRRDDETPRHHEDDRQCPKTRQVSFRRRFTFLRNQSSDGAVVRWPTSGRAVRTHILRVRTAALLSPIAGGRGESPVLAKNQPPWNAPQGTHACFALRMKLPAAGTIGGVLQRGLGHAARRWTGYRQHRSTPAVNGPSAVRYDAILFTP